MKRIALVIALLIVIAASPAFAQAPAHSGFTGLVNVGVGFQHDEALGNGAGVGGVNFGLGGFITKRIALLARFSGTDVDFGSGPTLSQTSGIFAGTLQCWLNRWASIEGGAGFGSWTAEGGASEAGLGLLIAFHASVFQKGRHHVRLGVEYVPVFTDTSVHNVGIVVGYQYVR